MARKQVPWLKKNETQVRLVDPSVLGLLAMGVGMTAADPAQIAAAADPVLMQPIVIEVANPCDQGVEFLHDFGSFTLEQYGYQSCPVPLF